MKLARIIQPNLTLVEQPARFEEWISSMASDEAHSLYSAFPGVGFFSPELSERIVSEFSKEGDIIFDASSKTGTVAVSTALLGREVIAADPHPFYRMVIRSRLSPVDLASIALRTQIISLKRPVNTDLYQEHFKPFFDIRTFIELVNLKIALQSPRNEASDFIELLVSSVLHGPSAGFLSVGTSLSGAPSPEQQNSINISRRQYPDYRAVLPRILKKGASVMRDQIPAKFYRSKKAPVIVSDDTSNLKSLQTESANVTIFEPALPGISRSIKDQWLRAWFLSTPCEDSEIQYSSDVDWIDSMNQSLLELTRVTKSGGRVVIGVPDTGYEYSDALQAMVEDSLSQFISLERKLTWSTKVNKVTEKGKSSQSGSVLVFRRR